VADRSPKRHSTRRRPHIRYQRKRNGFARVVSAFNKGLEVYFPLVPYRDSLGRSRTSGRCRRARAAAVLQVLLRRQAQVRSGIVYLGYESMGAACHRSRSTAYRAIADLVAAQLLQRTNVNFDPATGFAGGKALDEHGQVVEAANGYQVPALLQAPDVPQDSSPTSAEGTPGQQLAAKHLERYRERRRGP
jgi:hypothetical protein